MYLHALTSQVMSTDVSQGTSVLTSRKCSSTPSLPQATTDIHKHSVAASEQAASDDNLTAKVLAIVYCFQIFMVVDIHFV